MLSFNLKSKGRGDFHFGIEMTHQFCFMSSKFFFRSGFSFFPRVQVRNNMELRLWLLHCFFFFSSWVLNACLFIYFYHHMNRLVNMKLIRKPLLKKTEKLICKDVWVEECWFFFFLRSGFVYPQSPNLTLFSFKNKWWKLDPLEIPCIVQGRCISVMPHTWWTKWTERGHPKMLIHVLLPN